MTREELKDRIHIELHEGKLDNTPPLLITEKIMLMIDQYTTPPICEIWIDDCLKEIMAPSETINMLRMRSCWTVAQIAEEARLFIDREYPKQDRDMTQVRKHFFNYIRKRKPPTDKPDKLEAIKNW